MRKIENEKDTLVKIDKLLQAALLIVEGTQESQNFPEQVAWIKINASNVSVTVIPYLETIRTFFVGHVPLGRIPRMLRDLVAQMKDLESNIVVSTDTNIVNLEKQLEYIFRHIYITLDLIYNLIPKIVPNTAFEIINPTCASSLMFYIESLGWCIEDLTVVAGEYRAEVASKSCTPAS
jgi:hypothetical protein